MRICINFMGNLATFFGSQLCLNLDECIPLRELIGRLIMEKKAPLSLETLAFIDEKGSTLDANTNTCKHTRISVIHVAQGG